MQWACKDLQTTHKARIFIKISKDFRRNLPGQDSVQNSEQKSGQQSGQKSGQKSNQKSCLKSGQKSDTLLDK